MPPIVSPSQNLCQNIVDNFGLSIVGDVPA